MCMFHIIDGEPVLVEDRLIGGPPRNPHWRSFCKECVVAHPYCAACGSTKFLVGHHKKPFHLYPDLEMSPENILILCQGDVCNCHFVFGHNFSWLAYSETAEEDAARMLDRIKNRKMARCS
jgi:5-methylcytosine-specific restriction protein A